MGGKLGARQDRDRASREQEIAALAARQHGVVARRQLLAVGLSSREIDRRLESGRFHRLHYGVYAVGHKRLTIRGHWLAAVLACGAGALLSHRSAAALWGLMRTRGRSIEVSSKRGEGRRGIVVHESRVDRADRAVVDVIPVTTVARTLFDLAEVVDERRLERAFEEADRLGLLELRALRQVCARGYGRRALRSIRPLIDAAQEPTTTRSPLEDRFAAFCREHRLPSPATNVSVCGVEVDAFWPRQRLIVELDGFAYHRHRAAFERDRVRDSALQAAGYRVIRLTHRRLEEEASSVATELRRLLGRGERGQGTVEWVGLMLMVALLLGGLVAAGVRVPGAALARAVGQRILCAAALADGCGDEPALIAAYGTDVGKLVREHMPSIAFENGSRALPVDFRRCRRAACGDGSARGVVHSTDSGLPVTAFVHVIDCRPGAAEQYEADGADCSGARAGRLYIQYWTYYADSATLRGVPLAGAAGYHPDDWEGVQIRIDPDGGVAERASSHHGYNYVNTVDNWGSDAGIGPLKHLAEALGLRARNGWGPETHLLAVSGGSHAGNATGPVHADRLTPGRRVHLVPLEPIASAGYRYRFGISPPWEKQVWRDPEAEGTD